MNTIYFKKCWQEDLKTMIQFTDVKTLLYPGPISLKFSSVKTVGFHKGK